MCRYFFWVSTWHVFPCTEQKWCFVHNSNPLGFAEDTIMNFETFVVLSSFCLNPYKGWGRCKSAVILFASHLTERFHLAKVFGNLCGYFSGLNRSPSRRVARNVVSCSCENKHVTTSRRLVQFENSHVPIVISRTCKQSNGHLVVS